MEVESERKWDWEQEIEQKKIILKKGRRWKSFRPWLVPLLTFKLIYWLSVRPNDLVPDSQGSCLERMATAIAYAFTISPPLSGKIMPVGDPSCSTQLFFPFDFKHLSYFSLCHRCSFLLFVSEFLWSFGANNCFPNADGEISSSSIMSPHHPSYQRLTTAAAKPLSEFHQRRPPPSKKQSPVVACCSLIAARKEAW